MPNWHIAFLWKSYHSFRFHAVIQYNVSHNSLNLYRRLPHICFVKNKTELKKTFGLPHELLNNEEDPWKLKNNEEFRMISLDFFKCFVLVLVLESFSYSSQFHKNIRSLPFSSPFLTKIKRGIKIK